MSVGYHAAIVVAHPDDEALWCGGTLIRLKDAGAMITVICVTNANDDVRRREFETACGKLGAAPVIFDLPDGGMQVLPDFAARLDAVLLQRPDIVITHPNHGNERGHFQHRQCWAIVSGWARARGIPLAVFLEVSFGKLPGESSKRLSGSLHRTELFSALRGFFQGLRNIAGYLRHGSRAALAHHPRPSWRGAVQLAIGIDLARKWDLLAAYGSQIDGMRQYEMYGRPTEHIRFFDRRSAMTFEQILLRG
jgi:LmbE family N-acetylglucosaminyl deacetylase